MARKIGLFLLAGVIIAGIYGYYLYNKPVNNMSSQKVALTVSSEDLVRSFSDDEMGSNELYLDKIVKVTGRVRKVEVGDLKTSIYLDTTDPISSVICELEEGQETTGIQINQPITIIGLCTGYLMDVVLVRCIIENE